MYFFSARIDGLVKREESPEEMTESYVDRDDFMYYRQVTFGKRVKKVWAAGGQLKTYSGTSPSNRQLTLYATIAILQARIVHYKSTLSSLRKHSYFRLSLGSQANAFLLISVS